MEKKFNLTNAEYPKYISVVISRPKSQSPLGIFSSDLLLNDSTLVFLITIIAAKTILRTIIVDYLMSN